MIPDRPRQTGFDYMVAALSPALIITLIASLVFFLISVFYRGEFQGRLLFIQAMFVMGTVLIARLSITEGAGYAAMFGIFLAVAAGLAMMRFVEFPGPLLALSWLFNWSLLALIWWSAHKLTWNCTLIDETEDASGQGLLESFGWDRPEKEAEGDSKAADPSISSNVDEASKAAVVTAPANAKRKRARRAAPTATAAPLETTPGQPTWEDRSEAKRKQKRKRAPGVWVVFFSLAALPIFGIGQGFIDSNDVSTRRFAFWMLCIYVMSGLGLLLTTSLLGLRRYLRQRMLEMPVEMTGAWLMFGAMLVVALLAAVWILPRPSPEYSVSDMPIFADSPSDLRSSRVSFGNEPAPEAKPYGTVSGQQDQKSEGQKSEVGDQRSEEQKSGKQQSGGQQSGGQQPGGQKSEGQQPGGQQSRKQTSEGQKSGEQQSGGQQSQGQQSGEQQSGEQQSGGQKSEGQQAGGEKSEGQQSGEQQSGEQPPGDQQQQGSQGSQSGERSSSWFRDGQKQDDRSEPKAPAEQAEPESKGDSGGGPSLSGGLNSLLQAFVNLLKATYYLVFLAIALFFMWRYRRQLLEGFRELIAKLRAFWKRLMGRKSGEAVVAPQTEQAPPPRPFADFADPFTSGAASRWSIEELVRYSFLALEAWARERGCERRPEQTAHEFADQIGAAALANGAGKLNPDAAGLADLYSRVAYARGSLQGTSATSAAEIIRRLWVQLRPA